MSFYNTISFSGEDLKWANARASRQEVLILNLFKANPNHQMSPSLVHGIFNMKYQLNPPITSIRRAITDLTTSGELVKTEEMVKGLYHLPEHCWKLSSKNMPKAKISQGSLFL